MPLLCCLIPSVFYLSFVSIAFLFCSYNHAHPLFFAYKMRPFTTYKDAFPALTSQQILFFQQPHRFKLLLQFLYHHVPV